MANWGEKLNKMTQSAITKSKEMAEVTRLNMEIGNLKQNLKDLYTKTGEYVLTNGVAAEDETIAEYIAQMNTIQQNIEADEEKIKEVKNINICANCGAEVSRTSKFCDKCGTEMVRVSLEPEVIVCKNCGNPIEKDALFCGNCGAKQE